MRAADTPHDALQGLRVLIVEDEALVAMLLEAYLAELGCVVAGSASRVSRALETLQNTQVDAAILDLNVNGEDVSPIVNILDGRGTPFIFASGYAEGLDARWAGRRVLQKPFTSEELREALQSAVSRSSTAGN
jgi:CheY-like chemotaxis protein